MTDFKVGDVLVTSAGTLARIQSFPDPGYVGVLYVDGYTVWESREFFVTECTLASQEQHAYFKTKRIEVMEEEIAGLRRDIVDIQEEIKEEQMA